MRKSRRHRTYAKALSRLRHPETGRALWIDALCIYQQDVDEREQQVSLMSNIYRRGLRVSIWLGECSDKGNLKVDRCMVTLVEKLGPLFDASVGSVAGLTTPRKEILGIHHGKNGDLIEVHHHLNIALPDSPEKVALQHGLLLCSTPVLWFVPTLEPLLFG